MRLWSLIDYVILGSSSLHPQYRACRRRVHPFLVCGSLADAAAVHLVSSILIPSVFPQHVNSTLPAVSVLSPYVAVCFVCEEVFRNNAE